MVHVSSMPDAGQVYNAHVPLCSTLSKSNFCARLMLEVKTAQQCVIMRAQNM